MAEVTRDEVALLLSEGLDLCVRGRKLDEKVEAAVAAGQTADMRCGTPAVWVLDQYDRDLEAWQERSRATLSKLTIFA